MHSFETGIDAKACNVSYFLICSKQELTLILYIRIAIFVLFNFANKKATKTRYPRVLYKIEKSTFGFKTKLHMYHTMQTTYIYHTKQVFAMAFACKAKPWP